MIANTSNSTRITSITGCLIVQLCVGIIYLWSILKTPMEQTFGCGSGTFSMTSSYMLSAFVIGCLLGGMLNDKKGPQFTCRIGVQAFAMGIVTTAWLRSETIALINVTYAGLSGLGSGLAYSACVSCVQKWLPDRRGLATGLAVSSFGLSTVIFAPVFKGLINLFTSESTGLVDFGGVFSTLALIFLTAGLVGCVLIHLPEEQSTVNNESSSISDMPLNRAVLTPQYWCIFFTVFFINGTWNLAVPILYDLGIERGLTAAAATFAVSFTGIPNAAGRLIMASLSDKLGRRTCTCLLAVTTAVAALLMVVAKGWAFIVVVGVIAFAYGGPSSINAAMTTDYFGPRYSGTNYGVIMLALGASSLFFNALSASVLNGNMTLSFIVAAVSAAIPIVLMKLIGTPPAAEPKPHSLKNTLTHNV